MELATPAGACDERDAPVFVVGAGRSGTTLMRLILNAHPRIGIPGETAYFVQVYERFRGTGDWAGAVEAAFALYACRLRPAIDLTVLRAQLHALPAPDYAALLERPLRAWAHSEGKPRWGEKTPDHVFYGEPILAMFPRARFVELIRDPRAVVASMVRSRFKADDPTRNALYWNYVIETGHATLHRVAGGDRVHAVRYEDLVTEPERIVREVCAFVGEPFDPAMLAFHARSADYLSAYRSDDDPKLTQPVSADPDGWRAHLSERQLAITEAVCGANMALFGYARAGRPATIAERREIAAKRAYVAYKRRRQRDRYFASFTGPVAGGAARRLRRAGRAQRLPLPAPSARGRIEP